MMSRSSRKAGGRPLKRKVATRRPRKTLVVFCEGERTEPEYLDALKRQPAVRDVAAVDLRVETGQGGSVPRTLVAMATEPALKPSKKTQRLMSSGAYSTSSGRGTILGLTRPFGKPARTASISLCPTRASNCG
jgi:hypothetical protein